MSQGHALCAVILPFEPSQWTILELYSKWHQVIVPSREQTRKQTVMLSHNPWTLGKMKVTSPLFVEQLILHCAPGLQERRGRIRVSPSPCSLPTYLLPVQSVEWIACVETRLLKSKVEKGRKIWIISSSGTRDRTQLLQIQRTCPYHL